MAAWTYQSPGMGNVRLAAMLPIWIGLSVGRASPAAGLGLSTNQGRARAVGQKEDPTTGAQAPNGARTLREIERTSHRG